MNDGVIIINKPHNWTSHDVVAKIRGFLGKKKVGHTGTLDPIATGVLPICIGSATKLSDIISGYEKVYRVKFELGYETDTEDYTGNIINKVDNINVDKNIIQDNIYKFIGKYNQIPPMYSALKVNGRRLYELAREGQIIHRDSREVNILDIYDLEIFDTKIIMTVRCSKGTYIRSLCRDIGRNLGTYATMLELTRLQVGNIRYEQSIELTSFLNSDTPQDYVLSFSDILYEYKKINAKKSARKLLDNGNPILISDVEGITDDSTEYLMYNDINELIGIFYIKGDKLYPKIMLKR